MITLSPLAIRALEHARGDVNDALSVVCDGQALDYLGCNDQGDAEQAYSDLKPLSGRVYADQDGDLVYRIKGHRHGDGQIDTDDHPVWLHEGPLCDLELPKTKY